MEIVNIHCSECRGLIGINKEDLGHHVRCPLCQKVIFASQTQAESASTESPDQNDSASPQPQTGSEAPFSEEATAPPNTPEHFPEFKSSTPETASERESIFTPVEDTSDSLFGEVQMPRIEIPESDLAEEITVTETPVEQGWGQQTGSHPEEEPTEVTSTGFREHGPVEAEGAHSLLTDHPDSSRMPAQEVYPPHTVEEARPTALVQPRGYESRQSILVPTLLIFLIPYSIFTTLFLGYLLYNQRNTNKDPTVRFLEKMLEDNFKSKGNIKRIQYDLPLPDNLRTRLKMVKQIGAIEIIPLKVVQTPQGDLTLYLRMKNISLDLWFNPLPREFAKFDRKTNPPVYPYIFLEGDDVRLFGGQVDWLRGEVGKEKFTRNNELKPGEAMTVTLTTSSEDRELVPKILESKDSLLWRIQFRRGLEKLHGEDWPITCVMGIEFSPKEIIPVNEQ